MRFFNISMEKNPKSKGLIYKVESEGKEPIYVDRIDASGYPPDDFIMELVREGKDTQYQHVTLCYKGSVQCYKDREGEQNVLVMAKADSNKKHQRTQNKKKSLVVNFI